MSELATVHHCRFILPDGSICNDPNVLARGYCNKHYGVLRRAKAFTDTKPKPRTDDQTLSVNVRAVKRAKRRLLKNAKQYADLHLTAAQEAAKRGDARPSEWALLHTRTIEPVADATKGSTGNTVINVGVKFSGQRDQE